MLGRASPRKPSVRICPTSLSSRFCWWHGLQAEQGVLAFMPHPLSMTCKRRCPPCWPERAPGCAGSIEFSTSSFMTEAGRSMTSPVAMRPATSADNIWITSSDQPSCVMRQKEFLAYPLTLYFPANQTAENLWGIFVHTEFKHFRQFSGTRSCMETPSSVYSSESTEHWLRIIFMTS